MAEPVIGVDMGIGKDKTVVSTWRGPQHDTIEHDELARFESAPSCAPTYALTHRWNWPDANGVTLCSCGAWSPDSIAPACTVYAPALKARDRVTLQAWRPLVRGPLTFA